MGILQFPPFSLNLHNSPQGVGVVYNRLLAYFLKQFRQGDQILI
jgi:hypothetical protein